MPEQEQGYYQAQTQEQQYPEQTNDYLTDVNIKLRDIEEKQNLIKDRIILIGENLISEKEETEQDIVGLKTQMKNLENEIKKIKLAIQQLIESQENFARKGELAILENQAKMFQPMNLARISDVEEMIKNALGQK